MKIEPTYVTFEQAKLLRSKKFNTINSDAKSAMVDTRNNETIFFTYYMVTDTNEVTFQKTGTNSNCFSGLYADYNNQLSADNLYKWYLAPEQWQVIEWFRVIYGVWVDVSINQFSKPDDLQWFYSIIFLKPCTYTHGKKHFITPQQAYLTAFDYVLNNLI